MKIANAQGIELNEPIQKKVNKNRTERFTVEECIKDPKNYVERQQKILDKFKKRINKGSSFS